MSPKTKRAEAVAYISREAISRYLQKAFASCISRGVRHSASNMRGDATTTQMHLARDVATFKRFAL
jgi:hypothetical protein